jgi:hypothetical protein
VVARSSIAYVPHTPGKAELLGSFSARATGFMMTTMRPGTPFIVALISLFFLFLNCADPPYPFHINNVHVSVVSSRYAVTGDSLTLKLAVEGIEFIDSIRTAFGNDSVTVNNDMMNDSWIDTLSLNYKCISTGTSRFTFHTFLTDETINHDSLVLDVEGEPAHFTHQPSDTTIDEWTTLELFVNTAGTGTLHYSWFRDDCLLPEFTDDTLRIDTVDLSDAGKYFCVIANNWAGPDTTDPVTVSINNVNRKPELMYDTSVINVSEADSVCAIVAVNDPNGDSVLLTVSTVDSLLTTGDDIYHRSLGDSIVVTVKPAWKSGHALRQLQVDLVSSDGDLSDTAHLCFVVTDSIMPPRWKSNPYTQTVSAGKELSIPLLPLLEDPDIIPADLLLLDGLPDHDLIETDRTTYFLRAVYAVAGHYEVTIVARDTKGVADTLTIDLTVE